MKTRHSFLHITKFKAKTRQSFHVLLGRVLCTACGRLASPSLLPHGHLSLGNLWCCPWKLHFSLSIFLVGNSDLGDKLNQ